MAKPPKNSKNTILVIEQKMIKSKAWLSLSGTGKGIYLLFQCRCKIDSKMIKKTRKVEKSVINEGEIVFTYKEATSKYGISKDRFTRAIDQLVETGFIDIASTGQGQHKMCTNYSISGRWRDWGTDKFIHKHRHKPAYNRIGFQNGNELWKLRSKTNPRRKSTHDSTRDNAQGHILAMRTNAHNQKVSILYKFRKGKWISNKTA